MLTAGVLHCGGVRGGARTHNQFGRLKTQDQASLLLSEGRESFIKVCIIKAYIGTFPEASLRKKVYRLTLYHKWNVDILTQNVYVEE